MEINRAVTDVRRPIYGRRRLHVEIRSVTKDSLGVAWYSDVTGSEDNEDRSHALDTSSEVADLISGYKIRYQAVGSTYVQFSHLLKVSIHDIYVIFRFPQ